MNYYSHCKSLTLDIFHPTHKKIKLTDLILEESRINLDLRRQYFYDNIPFTNQNYEKRLLMSGFVDMITGFHKMPFETYFPRLEYETAYSASEYFISKRFFG